MLDCRCRHEACSCRSTVLPHSKSREIQPHLLVPALNQVLEDFPDHSLFVTAFGKKEFLCWESEPAPGNHSSQSSKCLSVHPLLDIPYESVSGTRDSNVNSFDFAVTLSSSEIHTACVNPKSFRTSALPMSRLLASLGLGLGVGNVVVSDNYAATVFPLFGEFSNILGEEGCRQFQAFLEQHNQLSGDHRTRSRLAKLLMAGGVMFTRHKKCMIPLGRRMFVSKIKVTFYNYCLFPDALLLKRDLWLQIYPRIVHLIKMGRFFEAESKRGLSTKADFSRFLATLADMLLRSPNDLGGFRVEVTVQNCGDAMAGLKLANQVVQSLWLPPPPVATSSRDVPDTWFSSIWDKNHTCGALSTTPLRGCLISPSVLVESWSRFLSRASVFDWSRCWATSHAMLGWTHHYWADNVCISLFKRLCQSLRVVSQRDHQSASPVREPESGSVASAQVVFDHEIVHAKSTLAGLAERLVVIAKPGLSTVWVEIMYVLTTAAIYMRLDHYKL